MDKRKILWSTFGLLLVAGTMAGCGSSSGSSDNNDTEEQNITENNSSGDEAQTETFDSKITVDFDAIVGTQGELVCSQNGVAKQYTLGSTNVEGTISDFRYFISDVKLKMSDGSTQVLKLENNSNQYYSEANGSVAILDFEDNTGNCINRGNDTPMNKSIVGDVNPTAAVEGIEFTVGVPLTLNHTEFPDIPVLNKQSMLWSWATGRKFTKLEINPTDDLNSTGDIFNFHLGSTGCASTNGVVNCTQPNRVVMKFDNFDPKTQKIVLDYSKLLTHTDIKKDGGGAKGCMSGLTDPECKYDAGQMFHMIGLEDEGLVGQCIDNDCVTHQKLFSVESK